MNCAAERLQRMLLQSLVPLAAISSVALRVRYALLCQAEEAHDGNRLRRRKPAVQMYYIDGQGLITIDYTVNESPYAPPRIRCRSVML